MTSRSRRIVLGTTAAALLLGLAVALLRPAAPHRAPPDEDLAPPKGVSATRSHAFPATFPVQPGQTAAGANAPAAARESRAQAEARLARAKETLERYRASTVYPPTSRPLSEEPDRLKLHEDAERTRPLDDDSSTRLTLGQDRTFLSAQETATLWVRCQTETGAPVRCQPDAGQVSVVPEEGQPAPQRGVPLPFRDDGQGKDAAADDGIWTATLTPAALGLGEVTGTLRVDLAVTDHRDTAHPFFTLVTTGEPPATFTGKVSESLKDGSLVLSLGISVKKAGQYVIHGRVDDARGQPLAWAEFNDPLEAGEQVVPLIVFGKLVRDRHPAFPLTLRDVDGMRLSEQGFPDRQVMAALAGPVWKTAAYREDQFSDAEWTSEQRDRYLTELKHDVDRAQDALDHAGP